MKFEVHYSKTKWAKEGIDSAVVYVVAVIVKRTGNSLRYMGQYSVLNVVLNTFS